MAPKLAIDSNIFIYVLENNPDFCAAALAVLKDVEAGRVVGYASELVYLEVLAGSKLRAQDITVIHTLLETSTAAFQPITKQVLIEAARLRRLYQSLKTPDAVHLASALAVGATQFITNDAKLLNQKIKGIELVSLTSIKGQG